MSLVEKARKLAIEAHGNQPYGNNPYSFHLIEVVDTLHTYGITNQTMIAAAWLHDTAEDTQVTLADIHLMFGADVMCLVYAVTNEPGRNRAEQNFLTYHKINAICNSVILKLADRISNVKNCLANNPRLLEMYRKEHPTFKKSLAAAVFDTAYEETIIRMWRDLDQMIALIPEAPKPKMVPCGTYGCTKPKPEGAVFCKDCGEEYKEDPDAFK